MRNFRGVVCFVALAVCCGCHSLPSEEGDRTTDLTAPLQNAALELSWESVGGDKIGFATVFPEGEAATLLWKNGKLSTEALVSVLENPRRGVAAHIILTYIYHRDRVMPTVRWIYGRHRGSPAAVMQSVNGLRWTTYFDDRDHRVRQLDLQQNAARWKSELESSFGGPRNDTRGAREAAAAGHITEQRVEN